MQKLINHLLINGEKRTSENNLVKASKNLQKHSGKVFNNMLKLAIVFSISIFKINFTEKTNKKNFFNLLQDNKARILLSTKYLINIIKSEKTDFFNKNFYNKVFLFFKNKNNISKKDGLQKQIFLNKHIFFYYR